MHDELGRRVDDALDRDGDFEQTWNELAAAIDAAPDDAALRRMRVRMAQACGDHLQHVADLNRLAEIEPDQRPTQLASAAGQYRLAYFCAAQQERAREDEDSSDDDDDDNDDGMSTGTMEALQSEALSRFVSLAEAQVADPAFMLELFAAWDDAGVAQPWTRLRLLVASLAASPGHAGLRRALALHWAELSRLDPVGYDPDGPPPIGFLIDAMGSPHEALAIERALHALHPLIEAAPDDLPLRQARAALHTACAHYAEAAADHRTLARAWEARAEQATDDEARDELLQQAAAARADADRCDGGGAAIVQASMAEMEQAASGIGMPFAPRPGQVLSDEKRAVLDEMQASMEGTRDSLLEQLGGARALLEAASAEPDAAQLAELEAMARKIGPQVVGALQFEPSDWLTLSTNELEAPLHDWLVLTGETLQSLGWRHLAWCENPAYRRMFGQQVATGLWIDAAGTGLAVAAAVKTIQLVEFETEFADGRQLTTVASRGKNFLAGGPMIDQLFVDPDLPLDEMARLHSARVALRTVEQPSMPAVAVADVAAFAAIQDRQRRYKIEFRRAHGLSEFEARGLPTDRPDHLVPAVQREVRRALDAALKAHRG